jgi:hypothetical protein
MWKNPGKVALYNQIFPNKHHETTAEVRQPTPSLDPEALMLGTWLFAVAIAAAIIGLYIARRWR